MAFAMNLFTDLTYHMLTESDSRQMHYFDESVILEAGKSSLRMVLPPGIFGNLAFWLSWRCTSALTSQI